MSLCVRVEWRKCYHRASFISSFCWGGRGEILAEQNVKNVNVIGQKPCGYQDVFFSLFFSSLFFFLNSPSQNISFSLFNLFNIPFHLILLLLPVIELFLLLSFFSLSLSTVDYKFQLQNLSFLSLPPLAVEFGNRPKTPRGSIIDYA